MEDMVNALGDAQNGAEAIGGVVTGLGVLATRYEQLWLIVEGQKPYGISSADIGMSLVGITVDGGLLIPFGDVKRWERDCGEPCVAFEMSGREAIIAPAKPPRDDQFTVEVQRFLEHDWFSDDSVYLSSLNGAIGDRAGCRELDEPELNMLRAPGMPSGGPLLASDTLRVLREDMVLGDMTWVERETDGDGNRHMHVVMSDGRYRRISLGDLGR